MDGGMMLCKWGKSGLGESWLVGAQSNASLAPEAISALKRQSPNPLSSDAPSFTIPPFPAFACFCQWTCPTELHGIGKYAADAYYMFCRGLWREVDPLDKDLKRYKEWLGSTGGLGAGLQRASSPGARRAGMTPSQRRTSSPGSRGAGMTPGKLLEGREVAAAAVAAAAAAAAAGVARAEPDAAAAAAVGAVAAAVATTGRGGEGGSAGAAGAAGGAGGQGRTSTAAAASVKEAQLGLAAGAGMGSK